VTKTGAFTGVNTLIGCAVTFAGDVTTALAGHVGKVISNTTGALTFAKGDLPATPQSGDHFTVTFSVVDDKLDAITHGKGMGNSSSDAYGYGPSLVGAMVTIIKQLGGTPPTWATATPFTFGSPHAGGAIGHGGSAQLAFLLGLVRTTVAAYTKPA
jgi:hypothetical protein